MVKAQQFAPIELDMLICRFHGVVLEHLPHKRQAIFESADRDQIYAFHIFPEIFSRREEDFRLRILSGVKPLLSAGSLQNLATTFDLADHCFNGLRF